MKNFKKYCKMLELDKIFNMVSEFAHCDETKELVKNLRPSSNLIDVKQLVGVVDRLALCVHFDIRRTKGHAGILRFAKNILCF